MQAVASPGARICVRCGTPPPGVVRFCADCWEELGAIAGRGLRAAPEPPARARSSPSAAACDVAESLRRETDGWTCSEIVRTFPAHDPLAIARARVATRVMAAHGYVVAAEGSFDGRRLLRWVRAR